MDRQEHYITIGKDERAYRSFVPTPLQDIHLEMDEEMQMLLAQAHERLKNRNLSDIDALQKEEVENSVNLVYGEKKSLALAFLETDDKEDKEDKKRKLDEQNLLLTSSSCHPKIFIKEFGDFLIPCHQHCLGVNLLVQR